MGAHDPRGMLGRIYVNLHITTLHTKYRSVGCCGFREEDFFHVFSRAGPVWTPGARLARFIKRTDHYTLLHTKYESSGPCGFREEDFFYVFPIVSLWELITPEAGPFFTPGAWFAGFIKRTTIHCYIQNIKALVFVVSEKKIFFMFFP